MMIDVKAISLLRRSKVVYIRLYFLRLSLKQCSVLGFVIMFFCDCIRLNIRTEYAIYTIVDLLIVSTLLKTFLLGYLLIPMCVQMQIFLMLLLWN